MKDAAAGEPFIPESAISIKVLRCANRFYARIYHDLTVLSPCHVPRRGPAILVSNHTSSIDPTFLQAACSQRVITWMMAKEYLQIRQMKWVFDQVGIIPVERSGRDTGPLRAAIRALEKDRVLGIFPEGRIAPTRELLPLQTGVALMAIKAKVPIIPAFLDGTQRNKGMMQAGLMRNKVTAAFGEAVQFNRENTSRENLDAATAAIRSAIESLREQTDQFHRSRQGRF